MRHKLGAVVWALVGLGCSDRNPYFVEPTMTTGAGETGTGTSGAPTTADSMFGTSTLDVDSTGSGFTQTEGVTDTGSTTETGSTTDNVCGAGTVVCDGAIKKVCDGSGGFTDEETCASQCVNDLGCVLCEPGSKRCAEGMPQVCVDDGSAWMDAKACDPLQGLSCDPNVGECAGSCRVASLATSNVGCDFYSSSLANDSGGGDSDIVGLIAVNTRDVVAVVTVTRGDEVLMGDVLVGAMSSGQILLPYIDDVVDQGGTVTVSDGAYRVRSTQPMAVYQFAPADPSVRGEASLLLPVHTWGTDYMVASREFYSEEKFGGFYAVVASEDGTAVTVSPGPKGGPVSEGAGITDKGHGMVTLDAGGVLEVFSEDGGDLTGTRVMTDKPVAVFGGHRCARVGFKNNCNHLEESMPPVTALSNEYFITPALNGLDIDPSQEVRVIAAEADTTIQYQPNIGGKTHLVEVGDWLTLVPKNSGLRITADKKILVAQYMTGDAPGAGPSLAVAVPTEQYRTKYLVTGAKDNSQRWYSVVARDNVEVKIDGAVIDGFVPVEGTGYSVVSLPSAENDAGARLLTSGEKFGVMVYGYADFLGYWYAGGMDLRPL